MFAVSRTLDKIFVHQPKDGLAVPVMLDIDGRSLRLGVPTMEELENDFAVYYDIDDAIRAAGPSWEPSLSAAQKFSRHYSERFQSQIDEGDITLAALCRLVYEDYRKYTSKTNHDLTVVPMAAERTAYNVIEG